MWRIWARHPLPCFQLTAWERPLGQENAALFRKRSLRFSVWSKWRKIQEKVFEGSKRGALAIGLCSAEAKRAPELGSWPRSCSEAKVYLAPGSCVCPGRSCSGACRASSQARVCAVG